jgi:hypothetical protein
MALKNGPEKIGGASGLKNGPHINTTKKKEKEKRRERYGCVEAADSRCAQGYEIMKEK